MSNEINNKKNSVKNTTGKRKYPPTEVYSEVALWECENLKTGFSTRINGVLAQVLKKYPNEYTLTFVSSEGA